MIPRTLRDYITSQATPADLEAVALLAFQSMRRVAAPRTTEGTTALIGEAVMPYGYSVEDIMNHTGRVGHIGLVRHMAYALVKRERPHLTLPQIGKVFGRDHSTIIHGIRRHEARMAWVEFLCWAGNPSQPDLFARAA